MKDKPLFEMDVKQMEEDIKEVQKALDKASDEALKAVKNEMNGITYDLLGEGMRRAPIKTGFLRGSGIATVNGDQSGHTEQTGDKKGNVVKDFKAGNISLQKMVNAFMGEVAFTAEYATIQHEDQSLNHNHPGRISGGEAKYLETPLKQKAPEYVKEIANTVKKAMEKGGG